MASVYFQPQSLTVAQVGQYLAGLTILYSLMNIIYRLYFHPISKYPGPKIWAATAIPSTYYTLRGTKAYKMSELHNCYGPIVRVGPYELSYISKVAEKDIYASHRSSGGHQLSKYKFTPPPARVCGIFNNPSDADHSQLRKILSVAFSDKALRERERFLQDYITLFITRLKELPVGEKVDLVWWLNCIGFDTVAHLTFGESFHALETSTLPELAHNNRGLLITSSRWAAMGQFFLGRLLYRDLPDNPYIPARKVFAGLFAAHEARRNAAKKGENEIQDLVSIMAQRIGDQKGLTQAEMAVVSNDFNITGGDTSASALSAMIYHLLLNPSKLQTLITEIRSSFSSEQEIKSLTVNGLKYLNAVINEGMRLNHPTPETTRRITGSDWNVICGQFAPANIRVGVYRYAAGHYSPAWKDVESFVPERWLGGKGYEDDQLGIVSPFATGPRNCIGQSFALVYMRLVLARLFWNFDLELCEESRNWLDMKVYSLIIDKGPLFVKLRLVR